jgi:Tfp pilus assembly protein PilF
MLTILGYLKALAVKEDRRWFAASVGCYALALMSKATVMTLPVTLLLLDWYPLGRLGRRWQEWIAPEARQVWVEKIPYLLLGMAGASMALYAQAANRVPTPYEDLPLPGRVSIMLWSLWFYVWKTLIPLGLSPLYEAPPQVNPLDPRFLGGGIAVGVITAGLLMLRRRWPAGLAVWIYYGVTLAPVSGLAHGGPQLTADRYSYLSCLGWALLVGAGVVWVAVGASKSGLLSPTWGYGMGAASAAWLIALGVLTWQQVHVWRDTKTLWTYTLSLYPNSSFAHNNLGALLARQGKLDEALLHYRKALEVNPNLEKAAVYLGAILYAKGDVSEAIEHYQRVLEMNPEFAEVHNNLGALLDRQGKADEAIAHYRQALRLRPTIAQAHFNLGRALLKQGKLDKAIKQIQRAVRINPDYKEARKLLDAVRNGKARGSVTSIESHQASRPEIKRIGKGVPQLADRQPAVANQGVQ